MRKCPVCKDKFEPKYNTIQKTCNKWQCALSWGKEKRLKKEKKAFNKETRERKKALKSRSDWLRETQTAFNAYIRARDRGNGCVSCDKPATWHGQWHASHYRPQGNCSPLRFHEMNVHKSCSVCNNHYSGNLIPFKKRLIEIYGEVQVEWMEAQNHPYTWDIEDLKEIKVYYRNKLKELEEEGK